MKGFYSFSFSFLAYFFLLVFLLTLSLEVKAGPDYNVWGWAWSENFGWVSFNSINCDYDGDGVYEGAGEGGPSSRISAYCPSSSGTPCPRNDPNCPSFCDFDQDGTYEGAGEGARADCPTSGSVADFFGVHICEEDNSPTPLCSGVACCVGKLKGDVVGYAWSEYLGWIRMDPPGPYPSDPNPPNYSTKVVIDPLESGWGCFSGWARACYVFKDNCDCGTTCQNLKPPEERGGWDGWLKMGDEIPCSYNRWTWMENSNQGNFSEFHGWAWGADESDLSGFPLGWIGWLSFSNENCDVDNDGTTDSGISGVCPVGQTVSEYKVFSSISGTISGNQAPEIVEGTPDLDGDPAYCGVGKGMGQIRLKWTYRDVDGDDQWLYQLQVDEDGDFVNTLPVVDCIAQSTVAVSPPPPSSNAENTGTSEVLVVTGVPSGGCSFEVAYGKSYYWRVRAVAVADGSGDCNNPGSCDTTSIDGCRPTCISDWKEYNDPLDSDGDGNPDTFTTVDRAYPWPEFTYSPEYPKVGKPVTFTDQSKCFDSSNNEFDCRLNTPPGDRYFWWDYGDGNGYNYGVPPEGPATVNHVYTDEDEYTVTLSVSDDCPTGTEPNCTCDHSTNYLCRKCVFECVPIDTCDPNTQVCCPDVIIPPPKWKEITPP